LRNQFEVTLKPSKHKRKALSQVLITSEDADSTTTAIRYNPKVLMVLVIVLCVIIGGLIGVIYYERQQDVIYEGMLGDKDAEIATLNSTNNNLNLEIDSLNNKIRILSDTVNTKTENEAVLAEALETAWIPKDFPLTGSASVVANSSEEPRLILKASNGATVVSTASGYIEAIEEDENYGNVVVVNHENGYKTYYRNRGQVMVKKGDDVVSGTTIYIIGTDNERLCYQISKDDEMLDPLDMLDING